MIRGWTTESIKDYIVFDIEDVINNDINTCGFGGTDEVERMLNTKKRELISCGIGGLYFTMPTSHTRNRHLFLFVDDEHIAHVIGRGGANLKRIVGNSTIRNGCNMTVKPLSVYKTKGEV